VYTGGNTSATFNITYYDYSGNVPSTDFVNNVLDIQSIPRYVEPQWTTAYPYPQYAWDVPFFYEDRRYLFYVTTTENVVTIRFFDGFGSTRSAADTFTTAPNIPVLNLTGPAPALGNNIRITLAPNTTITYQGQEIGSGGGTTHPTPTAPVIKKGTTS
jgi:hypothetical protein